MFQLPSQSNQRGNRGPGALLSFKAGKLNKNGTTVSADHRKGTLRFENMDGMISMAWKERDGPAEDEPVIVFPGPATWKKVEKVEDGRVYVMEWSEGDVPEMFFWMQEPKDDKDEEYADQINQLLTNGQITRTGRAGSSTSSPALNWGSGLAGDADDSTLQSLLQAVRESGDGDVAQTPANQGTVADEGNAPNRQIAERLGNADLNEALNLMLGGNAEGRASHRSRPLSLRKVLRARSIVPILQSNPDMVAALTPYIPSTFVPGTADASLDVQATTTPEEEVLKTLNTPDFGVTVDTLDEALLTHAVSTEELMANLERCDHDGSDPSARIVESISKLRDALTRDHGVTEEQLKRVNLAWGAAPLLSALASANATPAKEEGDESAEDEKKDDEKKKPSKSSDEDVDMDDADGEKDAGPSSG